MNAVCIRWVWSNSGAITPEGYSIHTTNQKCQECVKKYWKTQPDQVPEEYQRPTGDPFTVTVSGALLKKLKNRPIGVRIYEDQVEKYVNSKQLIIDQ